MEITTYGVFVFFLVFIIHIVLWRIKTPRNTTVAIIVLFTIGIISIWGAISALHDTQQFDTLISDNLVDNCLALLLALALAASYVMTYPALENDSLTLKLVYWIWKSQPAGITRQDLCEHFPNDALIRPSITKMISERLIAMEADSLVLTKRGYCLVKFYQGWRKLLRAERGG